MSEFDPYQEENLDINLFAEGEETAAALEFVEEAEDFGDDEDFGEENFDDIIAAGTRQEVLHLDANKPRYGIAVLNPISMADSTAYFYLGDFHQKNPRNPRGPNLRNLDFFPRLKLFPFTTQQIPIPNEGTASLMSEEKAREEKPAAFDVSTLESTLKDTRRRITRTAELFANQVYDRYKREGFVILHALSGIENYAEAEQYLKIVLTAEKVLEYFPTKPRERFGYEVKPPYLPEMIKYLERHALAEIEKSPAGAVMQEKLKLLRRELMKACRDARAYCEKTISQTEKLIADGHKDGYDLPNLEYQNAKPPTDLVCMAHLDRHPNTEKILQVARQTADALADRADQRQAVAAPGGFNADDVAKLLNAQQQDFTRQLDEKINSIRAELSPSAETPPAPPEAKTPASPKQKQTAK